jgi:hypothetical protein
LKSFLWVLFALTSVSGGLLLSAILLDLFVFKEGLFTLQQYIECILLLIISVFLKMVIIPHYRNKKIRGAERKGVKQKWKK